MKNLKKVLALVVVFSMMLCSVAFASFPDVAEDADYAVAVNTLAALGIVGGDDQGNFNPDNTITRAEFTKIVCEIQGLKGDANKGATAFTDVPADHWASGYINMATNLKIINGMGDGTFAPEAPVTYEQAVKMLVVTLGYAPMAADRGGYPTGHLVVAQTYGMTKNVAAPAQSEAVKRSAIAQIVYNTIDTPMMEQTGFGANVTYEVKDGNGDRERTTLLTSKFDVVKLGGVVVANEKIALEGSAEEGEIALKYDNNYKSTNEDFELVDRDDSEVLSNIEIGETNADELFGLRVIAYVRDNGKGYELIAIVAEEGKNASKEIVLSDIDTGDRTVTNDEAEDDGDLRLAYFESDAATKSTQLKIKDGCKVIWNSVDNGDDLDDIVAAVEAGDVSAKVELVDWDDDGKYDLIKVNQFFHYVVEEIDADNYTIDTLNGDEFYLEAEEVEYDITIEDADGEAVAFEDIKEGDVIAVISDNIDDVTDPANFLEITVLGQTGVEGEVRSYNANSSLAKVKIADAEYVVDAACYNRRDIALGSEGIFYLGVDGQIIAFDGSKAAAGNYGILIRTADNTSAWSDSYQVKILNTEGQSIVYDVADTLVVDDVEYDEADEIAAVLDDYDEEPAEDEIVDRMIQFKVNSSDEVKEISFVDADDEAEEAEFNATSKKLSGLGKVDSATVIFNINKSDLTKTKVITVDSLLDEAIYAAAGFGKEDGVFEAVMILEGAGTLAGSVDGWAVVTSVSETKENDADAYEIKFVENGNKEVKTILVTEDTEVDGTYNSGDALDLAATMSTGSLFIYAADANGVATAIALFANIDDVGRYQAYVPVIDIDATYGTGNNETTFAYVVNTGDIADLEFNGEPMGSDTYEYRFNNVRENRPYVVVGSVKGDGIKNIRPGATEGNLFFARLVDGEVVDVISITNAVPVDFLDEEEPEEEPEGGAGEGGAGEGGAGEGGAEEGGAEEGGAEEGGAEEGGAEEGGAEEGGAEEGGAEA